MSGPAHHPLQVLLVDDDPAAISETRALLAFLPEARCLEAPSLSEARRLLRRHPVDLAIVDLGLPDGSGLDLIRDIVADAPREGRAPAVCIVQTVYDDDDRLLAALAAGATGFVVKGDSPAGMQARIRAVLAGEPVLSPAIARRVLQRFVGSRPPARQPASLEEHGGLSPRELDVLQQVARGHTVAEVARTLDVSGNTIKTHLKSLYAKLGVHSRVGAVTAARTHGLLRD